MGSEGLEDAHNGVRSDDVVEVREPRRVSNGIINRAWEAVTYEGRSKETVENVCGCWGHPGAGSRDGIYGPQCLRRWHDQGSTMTSGFPSEWVLRTSFNMVEDGSASGGQYSNSFGVNNARIYINGKIHKYVGFEFNTECFNCTVGAGNGNGSSGNAFGTNSNIGLLDAIGKFEINEQVNVWFGRMLVPTERGELNGPFYHAVFDGFRTPFNQSDFSGNFGTGGAGLYGRDNGVTFFGKVHPGGTHLQYVAGMFTGLQSGSAESSDPRRDSKSRRKQL